LGSISIGTRLFLLDGVVHCNVFVSSSLGRSLILILSLQMAGEVESIKTTQNMSVTSGVRGTTYIVQIGSWGGGRRLVYGRDVFEDDRFYTRIERRPFNLLKDDPLNHRYLAKYQAFLGYEDDNDNRGGNRQQH